MLGAVVFNYLACKSIALQSAGGTFLVAEPSHVELNPTDGGGVSQGSNDCA